MRNAMRSLRLPAPIGCALGVLALALSLPAPAWSTLYQGTPSNYRSLADQLQAGDTLMLAAGAYQPLRVYGRNGTPSAWIVIRGTGNPSQTVINGDPGYNTVQIDASSYVAIENLRIDGRGYDVDGINCKDAIAHDIRIEGCTLVGLANNQGTVAISTKETVWNWTIRNNSILDPGTGIYLGNSGGDAPFISGVIEGNFIRNPIGYCMEIKHQLPYSLVAGMPAGPNRTIIRNNVFQKDDRPSEAGDRPNLLVGPFPTSGPGASDLYEIYGNFLLNNPRESLFQGSGRMTIHDNLLVGAGSGSGALYLTDHNGALSYATVYNNTIYGDGIGIAFVTPPRSYGLATGNLVFSGQPISLCGSCTGVTLRDNVTASLANAPQYVNQPSLTAGAMDFYPRSDCATCSGSPLDLSPVTGDRDYSLDFNGTSKGGFAYRGAYAGSGTNPGWPPVSGPKVGGPSSGGPPSGDTIPPSPPLGLRAR
jgi:hypothetical protein